MNVAACVFAGPVPVGIACVAVVHWKRGLVMASRSCLRMLCSRSNCQPGIMRALESAEAGVTDFPLIERSLGRSWMSRSRKDQRYEPWFDMLRAMSVYVGRTRQAVGNSWYSYLGYA